MLRWRAVPFDQLTREELYALLELRQIVFCVEQKCAYLDCDGKDQRAIHLLGQDASGSLLAYARLLPPGVSFADASIGRVVTHPSSRRGGLGRELMREAIARTRATFGSGAIQIGAQRYLQRFYEELGFVASSPVYDEDGIPHIEMRMP